MEWGHIPATVKIRSKELLINAETAGSVNEIESSSPNG